MPQDIEIRRSHLHRAQQESELSEPRSEPIYNGAAHQSSDWMARLLRSPIFQRLPSADTHRVLDRMEKISVAANDVIVTQGAPGDYYYVIAKGTCAVRRTSGGADGDLLLAELAPGDTFGEEALVGDTARNAHIVMLSDGQLLRLDKKSFVDLIRSRLVEDLGFKEAELLADAGAVWIDVRPAGVFAHGSLHGAINVPVALLRIESRKWAKEPVYVVCSDNPRDAAVGTFVLMECGFDARCLSAPLTERRIDNAGSSLRTHDGEAVARSGHPAHSEVALEAHDKAPERISPEDFNDSVAGTTLAELIDKIYESREEVSRALLNASPDQDGSFEQAAISLGTGLDFCIEGAPQSESALPSLSSGSEAAAPPGEAGDGRWREILQALTPSLNPLVQAELESLYIDANAQLGEVRDAAGREVRKRLLADRTAFHKQLLPERKRLEHRYDQLIALANRLAKRKALVQAARKALQTKLEAAQALSGKLDEVHDVLAERIDGLDKIEKHLAA